MSMKNKVIKKMYKLHSTNVAMGTSKARSTNMENITFYETEMDALSAAQHIMNTDEGCRGIVLYRAHMVLERNYAPLRAGVVLLDGSVQELSGDTF